MVEATEGLTITQAAEAMKVSAKTIRRYIKQGKIQFKTIKGKFGDEYRITELPTESPKPVDTTTTLTASLIKELQDANMELQEKSLQLAGQLGAALERIRTLENQVKLLAPPVKVPWWKRLFGIKS